MRKYLAFYENEWPANIAELTAVDNKPFVGYLKGEGVSFTVIPAKEQEGVYEVTYLKYTTEFPTDYVEVDLGLPSGKKWLDRNVGAKSPLDNGGYFTWGNHEGVLKVTETMSLDEVTKLLIGDSYTEEDKEQVKSDIELGLLENGNIDCLAQYPFGDGDSYNETFGSKLKIVYNADSDGYDIIDHNDNDKVIAYGETEERLRKIKVPLTYDIVYTLSNGQYKMPTIDDFMELCKNTTITTIGEDENGNRYDLTFGDYNEIDGSVYCFPVLPEGLEYFNLRLVEGMKFTASNGNSIYLPIDGYCKGFSPNRGCGLEGGNSYKPSRGSYLDELCTDGYYWSSSLGYGNRSCQLVFSRNDLNTDYCEDRCCGLCVRGIKA